MISAPLRPSSTMRVGATRRSPMPASAGVETATSGAARAAATINGLVQLSISAVPTLLHSGAIAVTFDPEWLIFGQPCAFKRPNCSLRASIIDRHVERAPVKARGGRRAHGNRPADVEVRS